MAKEIKAVGLTAGTNYFAVVVNPAGNYWTGTGNNFAAASGITWSAAGIALTADATITRNFSADFPTGITTAAEYLVEIYSRAGASPVVTDVQGTPAATGKLSWDGTQEATQLLIDQTSVSNNTILLTLQSRLGVPLTTIAAEVEAISSATGTGPVQITHNTPTANIWKVVDSNSQPIAGATIDCYLTSVYAAGTASPSNNLGQTTSVADGTWKSAIRLTPPGAGSLNYTLVFTKSIDQSSTGTITVSSAGVVTTP